MDLDYPSQCFSTGWLRLTGVPWTMGLQSSHFAKSHYKTVNFSYDTVVGLIKYVDSKVNNKCL